MGDEHEDHSMAKLVITQTTHDDPGTPLDVTGNSVIK